ncbi:MAG: hypothetical protein AABW52_06390 [Nanoarchaeota archaeon]
MKKSRVNARGKRPHHAMLLTSVLVSLVLMLTFIYISNNFNLGLFSGSLSTSITGYAVSEGLSNESTNETVTTNETVNENVTVDTENICSGELSENKILTKDVNDTMSQNCFILKSGITLDCNYYKISVGNPSVELQ